MAEGSTLHDAAQRIPTLRAWKAYWHLHEGLHGKLFVGALFAVGQTVALLPVPAILAKLIDTGLRKGDLHAVLELGLLMVGLSVFGACLTLVARWMLLNVTKAVTAKLRRRLIRHIHALPPAFHDGADPGTLHGIVVDDTIKLDGAAGAFLSEAIPSLAGTIGFLAVLLYLSPTLVLVVFLGYVPVLVITRWLARLFRDHHERYHLANKAFISSVTRTLRLLPLFRQAGIQDQDVERHDGQIEVVRKARVMMGWFASASMAGHSNSIRIGSLLVLMMGCWMIVHDKLSPGSLVAFYGGLALLNAQVQSLLNTVPVMVGADMNLRSIMALLEEPAEKAYHGTRRVTLDGRVSVEDAVFAYEPGRPVLRGLSVRLEPGQFVAIVGPSGSGKTTLLQVLLGIVRPESGLVRLGDDPMDDLDLPHVRRQIGFLSQDVLLLNATAAENLRIERPDAAQADLETAARAAQLHDVLANLPQGYDTPIGEGGTKLSGGQRQRLALARALLREPRLLLLDEPTHGLDPRSAREVVKTLGRLRGSCTILMVTHDLELVRKADIVHVLEEGRLVDSGTLDELEAKSSALERLRGLSSTHIPTLTDPVPPPTS